MKLYSVLGSPNGRKVEAVINHLGLPVEIEYLPFPTGLRTAEYLALNPNAKAPVLVAGTFKLWESSAIMQYLADEAGSALFPRDPQQRADIARWQFWEMCHFNAACAALAFELIAKPRRPQQFGPTDAALVARSLDDLARYAPVLERHLAGRRYLVGDSLSVAEYSMITFESYRGKTPFDWSAFGNINAYFDRVRIEDGWRRTVAQEQAALAQAAE